MSYIKSLLIFLSKFFLGLFIIIFVFCSLFIIFLLSSDPNKYKDMIVANLKQITGQEIMIEGPVVIKYFPKPKLVCNDCKMIFKFNKSTLVTQAKVFETSFNWNIFYRDDKRQQVMGKNVQYTYLENDIMKFQSFVDQIRSTVILEPCCLRAPNFKLNFGNNDLSGDVTLNLITPKIELVGKISSNFVLIDDAKTMIFPIAWLDAFNAQMTYDIKQLSLKNAKLDNVHFDLTLIDSVVKVKSKGNISSGDFASKLSISKKNASFDITSEAELKNVIVSELLNIFHPKIKIQDGKLDASFTGKTHGRSLDSVISNYVGSMLINMHNVHVPSQAIDARLVDFMSALWTFFVPKKQATTFECIVMRFNIQNGVVKADDSIGFQTPEIYALGKGALNLKTQSLDFVFNLYPASQLNFEAGSFNNVVYLKGTLASPKWSASKQALLKEGGTIALGVATGGLSLLAEKLYKISTQKGSVCQQVLDKQ